MVQISVTYPLPVNIDGQIAHWHFQTSTPLQSVGAIPLTLQDMSGEIRQTADGIYLRRGQWLRIPRADCGALNIHGAKAQVTVLARVLRLPQPETYDCETIAGVWDESRKKRQYCLFLDLPIWNSADQVGGHISSHGAATPGYPYCMEAAIGATAIPFDTWVTVGFTYDGSVARAYLNGVLDARPDRNPFHYPHGLFNGGTDGADFTVGAVSRSGEPGNFFHGMLQRIMVFDRALSNAQMQSIHAAWDR